ncbi:hypothetical protein Tco_0612179 [Tanacetum coccineum]
MDYLHNNFPHIPFLGFKLFHQVSNSIKSNFDSQHPIFSRPRDNSSITLLDRFGWLKVPSLLIKSSILYHIWRYPSTFLTTDSIPLYPCISYQLLGGSKSRSMDYLHNNFPQIPFLGFKLFHQVSNSIKSNFDSPASDLFISSLSSVWDFLRIVFQGMSLSYTATSNTLAVTRCIDNLIVFSKLSAINGFEISLPVAVCSGVANALVQYYGALFAIQFLVNCQTINGFEKSLPKLFALD